MTPSHSFFTLISFVVDGSVLGGSLRAMNDVWMFNTTSSTWTYVSANSGQDRDIPPPPPPPLPPFVL